MIELTLQDLQEQCKHQVKMDSQEIHTINIKDYENVIPLKSVIGHQFDILPVMFRVGLSCERYLLPMDSSLVRRRTITGNTHIKFCGCYCPMIAWLRETCYFAYL